MIPSVGFARFLFQYEFHGHIAHSTTHKRFDMQFANAWFVHYGCA